MRRERSGGEGVGGREGGGRGVGELVSETRIVVWEGVVCVGDVYLELWGACCRGWGGGWGVCVGRVYQELWGVGYVCGCGWVGGCVENMGRNGAGLAGVVSLFVCMLSHTHTHTQKLHVLYVIYVYLCIL